MSTDPTQEGVATMTALRKQIPEWRRQAIMACSANPVMWIAVKGVSLEDYLAQLDNLDAEAVRALKLFQEGAAA